MTAELTALVEREIAAVLDAADDGDPVYGMLRYHLGWVDSEFHPLPPGERQRAGGKKQRGVMTLLACGAAGGDVESATAPGAAVELVHNFSLLHDDIEDGDRERRHRPTVWALWGIPQAINAGSLMQALASQAALRWAAPPDRVVGALSILTCAELAMTGGQARDIGFEGRWDVTEALYLEMIAGKTAALFGAATELGALAAGAADEVRAAFRRFGEQYGLAFQVRDDLLGIWGEPEQTGKPVGGDIVAGKRSLPLLHALQNDAIAPELRQALERRDVPRVMDLLEQTDARRHCESLADAFTEDALREIALAEPDPAWGRHLHQLARLAARRER
jgi:geranylgeranyl diphosphate synthase, type I